MEAHIAPVINLQLLAVKSGNDSSKPGQCGMETPVYCLYNSDNGERIFTTKLDKYETIGAVD